MENQAASIFGRTEPIVIPFPGQPTVMSLNSPADTTTDGQRTVNGQTRTYTFKQAAVLLAVNESTLRRRYWQEKIEPAFKHCLLPLRTIARYNRDDQPVYEFSEFGLEVLKAFLAAKSEGREEAFLLQARQQYPVPSLPETASSQPYEVVDGEPVELATGKLATLIETRPAAPLIEFHFATLNVKLAVTDTTPLTQQTHQAQQVTAQAADVLQQAISAKFKADIAQVVAQNEHLAAGIQATAVVNAMQSLELGKPTTVATETSTG